MSYSNPDRRFYVFPAVDYGAGDSAHSFRGPKGKKGRLVDIHLSATEAFNSTTTDGYTDIGTAADTNAYAHFVQGDLAATDSVCGTDGVTDTDWLIDANIPADTQVEVTCVAPTGGTPTGIATVTVVVDWAD
jgi:hypothetical protein